MIWGSSRGHGANGEDVSSASPKALSSIFSPMALPQVRMEVSCLWVTENTSSLAAHLPALAFLTTLYPAALMISLNQKIGFHSLPTCSFPGLNGLDTKGTSGCGLWATQPASWVVFNPLLDTKPSFSSLEALNHPDGLPPQCPGTLLPQVNVVLLACLHHSFIQHLFKLISSIRKTCSMADPAQDSSRWSSQAPHK